jgi:transcription antitermination factor NusG
MFDWFALYVRSRHEKAVAQALFAKGFESCLPLTRTPRTWSDRRAVVEEPVFPGYVFCKFDSIARTPILRTSGVVRIVGAGTDLVPLGELAALQVLERTKASVEQWPYVEKGDRVYIEAGPLSGLSGIVTECKKGLRVLVSVSLLQRTVAVEVSRCQIRRTKPLLAHRSAAAGAFAVSRGCFAVGSAAGNRPPADRE